jgi:hypothetical protein
MTAPRIGAGQKPEPSAALVHYLDGWLAQAPPDLAEALSRAALPHAFDVSLLRALLGADARVEQKIERLRRAGLVAELSPGRFAVQPLLRPLLLQRAQSEDPNAYRRRHSIAAAHYRRQSEGEDEAGREALYHQLGAGGEESIVALRTAFERAAAQRQWGAAEAVVRAAGEHGPALEAWTQEWLSFLQARVDLAFWRHEAAEARLQQLRTSAQPALRGQALAALAELLTSNGREDEAHTCFAEALDQFVATHDLAAAARLLAARGDAVLLLATRLGGLPGEAGESRPWLVRWLQGLQHAPFWLYRWFSRRLAFLPNLYFGGNYQDWLIIRLCYQAIDDYEQAARQLEQALPDPAESQEELRFDIEIRLADLRHRLGEWAAANKLFAGLGARPAMQTDAYRQAVLQLALARAALSQNHPDQAVERLQRARPAFERYADHAALSRTQFLWGRAEAARANTEAAVAALAAGIDHALAAHEWIEATHALALMRRLAARSPLGPTARAHIAAAEQRLQRRGYIVRFPGLLHRRLQGLALYIAVPLAYLLIYLLAGQVRRLGLALEAGAATIPAGAIRPLEWLGNLGLLIFVPLLSLWLYELIYAMAGWWFVRRLRGGSFAEVGPAYIVTTPAGIVRSQASGQDEMAWEAVERCVQMDLCWWRRPSALFSRLALLAGEGMLPVEGIVNDYEDCQRDIFERLTQTERRQTRLDLSFSFLRSPWLLLALALTLTLALVAILGVLDPDHELAIWSLVLADGSVYELPLTTALAEINIWGLRFIPIVALARLLAARARVQRQLGSKASVQPAWPVWLALALLVVLTLLDIWSLTL